MCVCICTISKDIGINGEEEKCLPSKESIRGHRHEGSLPKVKSSLTFAKTTMTTKQGILKGS